MVKSFLHYERQPQKRLHRCPGVTEQPTQGGLAARGSRLWRRLVPRRVERQRDTRLHPWPKAAHNEGEIWQAPIQTTQPPLSWHCFAM